MRLMSLLAMIFGPVAFVLVLSTSPRSVAAEQSADVPVWLNAHVGEGDGQIALTVLQRARALYMRKVSEGVVRNPCYFAMDATRSADLGGGKLGRRFYVICEADQSFRAISSGHGSGRNLKGVADFSNGRQCAKNFGNAQDFEPDGWRSLHNARNEDVVQRLLSRIGEAGRCFQTLVRAV